MPRNNSSSDLLRNQGYFGEEIITGEAVALEMPSATVVTRLSSAVIDATVYLIPLIYTEYQLSIYSGNFSGATVNTLNVLTLVLWLWIIPALVTGLSRGLSLGRILTSTRIVRLDGGTLTIRQAFIRSAVAIIEGWLTCYAIAFFVMLFNNRAQRLGDLNAGTYVVRWPKGRKTDYKFTLAPNLATWADVVQTREAPSGLLLNISNHFHAAKKMEPQARKDQAMVLAAATENYVAPPPPWGTDPEDFISAFVLIRHQVEFERGAKVRERQARLAESITKIPFSVKNS
ncbi:RDD family protein [Arcanobacterium ihumii]|uniref:RDD family protein n=1 Tax=Arcanobacterium ihumii TaxID=2138162 RepID=UPI000F528D6E|nr:RDD family protein [Arcanobacterium ihumii]